MGTVSRNPIFDNWNVRRMEEIVGACTICMVGGPGVDMGPADSLCETCIRRAYEALTGEAPAIKATDMTKPVGPDARTLEEIVAGVDPSEAAAIKDSGGADVTAVPYCPICEQTFASKSALGSHNYQQKNKKHAGIDIATFVAPVEPQEQAQV